MAAPRQGAPQGPAQPARPARRPAARPLALQQSDRDANSRLRFKLTRKKTLHFVS